MDEKEIKGGGGAGGGAMAGLMAAGENENNKVESIEGAFCVTANQIDLVSMTPPVPAVPGPSIIGLLAMSETMDSGEVTIGADKGVRITAGPPSLPPAGPVSESGVEIVVGEEQNITLQRGLITGVDQMVKMTPSGITIDGGSMQVTIQSMQSITLSVAEGATTIKLDPTGVTIQGAMIKIQADGQAQMQAPMVQVNGDGMVQIQGGVVMIN
jgi:hypothetical protein